MIASDIASLETRAFSESSQKEKLFFLFITKGKTSSISLGESPSEQLCLDAFVLNSQESEALKKLQRTKPLKNIHYSKNLIDLIAAARIDLENEKEHINEYLGDHGLREAFLIHLALGVEIPKNINVKSDLDRLIETLYIEESYDDAIELFLKLLPASTHIFDVIALKELYKIYLQVHPDSKNIQDFEYLRVISKKVCHTLNGIIMLFLTSIVAFMAVEYINWYIENKKLHDEFQKMAIQIFSVLLIVAMFLGLNIPDKVKFLDFVRHKIFRFIYFLLGLSYSDVKKILQDDIDKST